MSNHTQEAMRWIDDLHGPYDLPAHQLVFRFCQNVKSTVDEQGAGGVAKILARMKAGAATSHFYKRILLCSTLADVTGEPAWFDALFDDAMAAELDFDLRHTLMTHLGVSLFLNRSKLQEADYERLHQVRYRQLFTRIVEQADEMLAGSSITEAAAGPVEDRVVILTPQFLRVPHATTMRALEYVGSLIDDFGKTPVIVEAHVEPMSSPIAFVPPYSAHQNDALRPVDRIQAGAHSIEYYRIAAPTFGLQELAAVTGLISALSPELVIAIGAPFVAAEAIALRSPTFAQTTTSEPPITVRAKSFSWLPLSPEQQRILEDAGVADTRLFDMHPGFSLPATAGAQSRSDHGLPDTGFLFAVVGNRLDVEVDAAFLDLLETIAEDSRAGFVMMGDYKALPTFVAGRPKLAERVHLLGFQEDILAALRLCDAYLNPDRTGGGRSVAYAMHVGLPVLSLKRGDVAGTAGVEQCQDSYADIAARAKQLMDDASVHAEQRAKAEDRAREVIGARPLLEQIFAAMAPAA